MNRSVVAVSTVGAAGIAGHAAEVVLSAGCVAVPAQSDAFAGRLRLVFCPFWDGFVFAERSQKGAALRVTWGVAKQATCPGQGGLDAEYSTSGGAAYLYSL